MSRYGVAAYYDPYQFPADEHEDARAAVRSWLDEGRFVLNWMREYHLDKDGRVIST